MTGLLDWFYLSGIDESGDDGAGVWVQIYYNIQSNFRQATCCKNVVVKMLYVFRYKKWVQILEKLTVNLMVKLSLSKELLQRFLTVSVFEIELFIFVKMTFAALREECVSQGSTFKKEKKFINLTAVSFYFLVLKCCK